MQSTTLGPKLMFWLVSYRLVAASAPLRHRVLGCRFATSSGRQNYCRVFLAKKHPIHNFRSKTHVLGGFAPFGCRKCTVATSGPRMSFCHEFGLTKLLSPFSVKKHPIHNFRSKTHVLGGFAPFGCRKCTVATSGPGMPFCHEFGPTKLLSSFFGQKASSPLLSVQNSLFGWFRTIWLSQVHRCEIGS